MTPYIQTFDGFFPDFEFDLIKSYAMTLEYKPVVAPFDGQTYQNIGLPVPPAVEERLAINLTWVMGYKVVPAFVAFRLSPEGSNPPQWAHTDAEVSKYGMFVYINDGPGGTVALRHKETGMDRHPRTEAELEAWRQDYDDMSKWDIRACIDCKANRAVILRSEVMHAALPKHGFGTDVTNGRLILLAFFD
jgi:hypothetical protein